MLYNNQQKTTTTKNRSKAKKLDIEIESIYEYELDHLMDSDEVIFMNDCENYQIGDEYYEELDNKYTAYKNGMRYKSKVYTNINVINESI